MLEIEVNDLRCHLKGASGGLVSYLKKFMRHENDLWVRKNNKHVPKYKYYLTDKGRFLTGFLPRVVTVLKKKELDFQINDNRTITSMPDIEGVSILLDSMKVGGNKLKLRDYQVDSLVGGLKSTRGVFDLATGAGKTIIMAALMVAWRKKTLVVINSKDLANQLQDELQEYTQHDVGFIGSGIWNPKDFTVAIDRSLVGGGKKAKKYLRSIEYLVFDEVHHVQSKTWRKISRSAKNASIRHGFSGTPDTSEIKKEDGSIGDRDLIIEGYVGPTISRVTVRDLIELGWLSDCKVKVFRNDIDFDGNTLPYAQEYDRAIVDDDLRNELICELMAKGAKEGLQVIGFVDRIDHGDKIFDKLVNDFGIDPDEIRYVHGNCYGREESLMDFKRGEASILFGTVLNEGLNFICDYGINCAGGKSAKKLKQRIGRILRKPKTDSGDVDKDNDRVVEFYDFKDNGHPWFVKHGRKRISTYKSEGYQITVTNPD